MMNPLVSICIPTYNGEKYLQEALNSVKAQTYKNFEVVISDDSSVDSTVEICDKFKEEVDFQVTICNHKPGGIGANWNHCVQIASGEFIKFLFQDDLLEPNCIEEHILLINKTKAKAVCCKRMIIDNNSEVILKSDWIEKYGDLQKAIDLQNQDYYIFRKEDIKIIPRFFYNIFGEPDTFLYHKSLFKTVGLFNETYRQILDLEYSYRILEKFPIVIQNKKLIRFRLHDNQASSVNNELKLHESEELEAFVKKKFFKYLPSGMKKSYYINKYPILKKIYTIKSKYFK